MLNGSFISRHEDLFHLFCWLDDHIQNTVSYRKSVILDDMSVVTIPGFPSPQRSQWLGYSEGSAGMYVFCRLAEQYHRLKGRPKGRWKNDGENH
jgi:hypothetical protein